MRKKIVAGNWKMNLDIHQGETLVQDLLKKDIVINDAIEVILFPSFIHLSTLIDLLQESEIKIGAQNNHPMESGAFTGEVSATMLASLNVNFCLVGHSERRTYNHENHEVLSKKLDALYHAGIRPIYCLGEHLEHRENGSHFELIKQQLSVLFEKSNAQVENTVVAYEPVWAIGTGKTASSAQAQEMHAYIRSLLQDKFGNEIAQNTSLLYGGSCNPKNAKELFSQKDVDGGLIGGASLNAEDFAYIISAID
ncbi:MAG: triose-phosphate isomerase [Verrucomicrobia bacterium]|nr:triose-phosphate isomerase [Verrucomicrobiota bacterium]|tara:strand:- start:2945 stop:3700 length:756 start_codon:yes stop_codon:yes gene_type:complete